MILRKYFIIIIFPLLTVIFNNSCKSNEMKIAEGFNYPSPEKFEKVLNGKKINLYTIQNKSGIRADITNYGGRIVTLLVPGRDGIYDDIVAGYHSIDEYLDSSEPYFGALIGRYGNRIKEGKFSIDGQEYQLEVNNGPNSLHGGPGGLHNVVWDAFQPDESSLELTYLSPHLEEGFPGNLKIKVKYSMSDEDELIIEYSAETDRKTVINLTSHAFFNLAGEGSKTINGHRLKINADHFTPVDETLIPTGILENVEGTPFDFREFTLIGERVDQPHQQLLYGKGYDHNFVLRKNDADGALTFAAAVFEPGSGRMMEIYTTEPGIQFYGGNFLDGSETGKRGETYLFRTSFCLETQHFPDSPNKPEFPSVILEPGDKFSSRTVHRFSVKQPDELK